MVSFGRAKRVSYAFGSRGRPQQRNKSRRENTTGSCACEADDKLLRGTVASLQAGVLMLKQALHVSDQLRKEQSECFKSSILDIKQCILRSGNIIRDFTGNTVEAIQSLSTPMMTQVFAVEDRMRLLEVQVESPSLATSSGPTDPEPRVVPSEGNDRPAAGDMSNTPTV